MVVAVDVAAVAAAVATSESASDAVAVAAEAAVAAVAPPWAWAWACWVWACGAAVVSSGAAAVTEAAAHPGASAVFADPRGVSFFFGPSEPGREPDVVVIAGLDPPQGRSSFGEAKARQSIFLQGHLD